MKFHSIFESVCRHINQPVLYGFIVAAHNSGFRLESEPGEKIILYLCVNSLYDCVCLRKIKLRKCSVRQLPETIWPFEYVVADTVVISVYYCPELVRSIVDRQSVIERTFSFQ